MNGETLIPIELIWEKLEKKKQEIAIRMLKNGELSARGSVLLMDNSKPTYESRLGKVVDISLEFWRDSGKRTTRCGQKFQLLGCHPDDVMRT
jgi:hypothetical protein